MHRVSAEGDAIETLAVETFDHGIADLEVLADGVTLVIAGACLHSPNSALSAWWDVRPRHCASALIACALLLMSSHARF